LGRAARWLVKAIAAVPGNGLVGILGFSGFALGLVLGFLIASLLIGGIQHITGTGAILPVVVALPVFGFVVPTVGALGFTAGVLVAFTIRNRLLRFFG